MRFCGRCRERKNILQTDKQTDTQTDRDKQTNTHVRTVASRKTTFIRFKYRPIEFDLISGM
jgi:hypothetical protein